MVGLISLGLGSQPTGTSGFLRRASIGIVGLGIALSWLVRFLLDGACARRVIESCSENPMVAVSVLIDAAVVALVLLVVSASARRDQIALPPS
jgi:hypothetical protein